MNYYSLYGQTIVCGSHLNLPSGEPSTNAITVSEGLPPASEDVRARLGADPSWFTSLEQGEHLYMSWKGVAQFAVTANEVRYELDGRTPWRVVEAYLANQVLSSVLLHRGVDALHGVACEWQGQALLIAGDSGQGKSTLLTALLKNGARFVSDDLLILEPDEHATIVHRGLPRMKLYSEVAERSGLQFMRSTPMNPYTDKCVCELPEHMVALAKKLPVRTLYVLGDEELTLRAEDLFGLKKFEALAGNLFNSIQLSLERKTVGLRAAASWSKLRVVALHYPRKFEALDEVVASILEDKI